MTNWNWQRRQLWLQHVATCKSPYKLPTRTPIGPIDLLPSPCHFFSYDKYKTRRVTASTLAITVPATTHVPSIHKHFSSSTPAPATIYSTNTLRQLSTQLKMQNVSKKKTFCLSLSSGFLSFLPAKRRKMRLNWRVNKINLPFAWREKMRTHWFCKWSNNNNNRSGGGTQSSQSQQTHTVCDTCTSRGIYQLELRGRTRRRRRSTCVTKFRSTLFGTVELKHDSTTGA